MRIGVLGSGLMAASSGRCSRGPATMWCSAIRAAGRSCKSWPGKKAATLIRDVGFNPFDVGSLSIARYVEPCSLMLAEIAYNGSDGPELAYRFEHLSKRKSKR